MIQYLRKHVKASRTKGFNGLIIIIKGVIFTEPCINQIIQQNKYRNTLLEVLNLCAECDGSLTHKQLLENTKISALKLEKMLYFLESLGLIQDVLVGRTMMVYMPDSIKAEFKKGVIK